MTAWDWGLFWQFCLVMFVGVPLFMTWIFAMVDLFMRPDLSGLKKVLWLMAILFLPLIGTILYFVFRPMELAPRYTYGAGLDPTTEALAYGPRLDPTTDRLSTLADLHDRGVINDEQYNSGRAALLT